MTEGVVDDAGTSAVYPEPPGGRRQVTGGQPGREGVGDHGWSVTKASVDRQELVTPWGQHVDMFL